MEQVLAMASDLLMTVVMGLLILLFTTAKKYAVEKIGLIQDEKVQKLTMNALDRSDDLAEKVVKKLQQTMVNDFKEASEDGKLTGEEIAKIGSATRNELGILMNQDLHTALSQTVGDVNLYMQNLIESKVLDLKRDFITVNALTEDLNTAPPMDSPAEASII